VKTESHSVAKRKKERGSSLIEVTLAMGLMAGVLGSVAGLFVLGAGGVHSGRRSSEALSVARSIMEEMQGWGFEQTYEEFGFDGANNSYEIDTRFNPNTTAWQAALDEKLSGHATITITAIDAGGPSLDGCTQMRLAVTIHWQEGSRKREAQLQAVRM
jgi:type II secretory pathway pseudopilin PulG